MSQTTDIILAAGPTIVGIGGLAVAGLQQWRGFAHERRMSDLEGMRALFDDAAETLHQADYARYRVEAERMSHGASLAENAPEAIAALRDTGERLDRLTARLAVRLGPERDPVVQFRAATEAILAVWRLASTPAPLVLNVLEHNHTFETANEKFNDARKDFLAAAAKTAGAQLP